ncbi:MAG: intradiol ring-cleavage dioxygenase [Anaerolineae bacterium]|nr:intradiol ring-cleavage dioxygenase [Anaerolineae bacterium]
MELHDDDKPIGRVLTRREILKLFGGASAGLIAGAGFVRMVAAQSGTATPAITGTAVPTCVVKPALTEGPYFVDEMLNRSDIRIDPSDDSVQEGALLKLIYHITNVTDGICEPLEGVQVDVWHCNAEGWYSDVADRSFDTSGQQWLRGYQVTDEDGIAEFTTIYPGWYPGRAVHIHFKMRTDPGSNVGYEFTSQLFFDEDLTDMVHAEEPYAAKGYRNVLNENDGIFQGSDGLLTLDVVENPDEEEGGYIANFYIGLDLNAETSEAGFGGPSGGGPGGGQPPGRP